MPLKSTQKNKTSDKKAENKKNEKLITKEAVKQVLFDYVGQYKKYPWQTTLGILLPALGTICVLYVPPLVIAKIIDTFNTNARASLNDVYLYIFAFGGVWLLGEALWRIGMHLMINIEANGVANLMKESFKRLAHRDYDFYANNFVGTLTKKALSFSSKFEHFTDTLSFNVFNNLLPALFAVLVLWQYSPIIPTILVACLIAAVAIGIPIVRKRSKLVAERHDAGSKVSGRLSDAMTNILAIKSFAKEDVEHDIYAEYVEKSRVTFKKAADYQNLRFDTVISPIYVATNVIGLIAAVFFANTLSLSSGMILVVFSYYSSVTRIFWDINRTYRNIESSIGEAAEFTQMLLAPANVLDMPEATELTVKNPSLHFKNVSFSYSTKKDVPLFLDNFNLNINSNQKIGLVGPSGGGKTTITKLLLRFINIKDGSITIDRQDISKVTQTSLRSAIAYVPQDPLLFHRSLFENIAYSNEQATKKEVLEAAKLARADEFISKLPHGYDTLVGERGIKLSGGQRQRVAIARAILKKAPILILDEATSALDSESEKYIKEGLHELMKNKTAIVIAHRLSTIRHLDRIIVLDDGKIVQDGSHEELIKEKGMYAMLWGHQSGEFLTE